MKFWLSLFEIIKDTYLSTLAADRCPACLLFDQFNRSKVVLPRKELQLETVCGKYLGTYRNM